MANPNLRHLRLFLVTVDSGSVTQAAISQNVTQSAATQALKRVEEAFDARLFDRTSRGVFPTDLARMLAQRVRRALDIMDRACESVSPRLRLTATAAQLRGLVAASQAESLSLGARKLGVAQPTVHRAIVHLESEVGRSLFRRTQYGSTPTRIGQLIAQAAQLAFAELRQAEMELAEAGSRGEMRIMVGAMPLSRTSVLPEAISRFQEACPRVDIRVHEGPYASLLAGLRRGELDLLLGALRPPALMEGMRQERLFEDELAVVCGPEHPFAKAGTVEIAALAASRWVVALPDTPARRQFDAFLSALGPSATGALVETGSQMLMRELLLAGPYLGCISRLQVRGDIDKGVLVRLAFDVHDSRREIGITTRDDWHPTRSQAAFLDTVRAVSQKFGR